nr:hypothetical protein [Thioalkalivibrio sp. HK1]
MPVTFRDEEGGNFLAIDIVYCGLGVDESIQLLSATQSIQKIPADTIDLCRIDPFDMKSTLFLGNSKKDPSSSGIGKAADGGIDIFRYVLSRLLTFEIGPFVSLQSLHEFVFGHGYLPSLTTGVDAPTAFSLGWLSDVLDSMVHDGGYGG